MNIEKLSTDQPINGKAYSKHKDSLINHIFKIIKDLEDSKDLASTAWTQAYSNMEKFDGKYEFSTWLYTIANNLCFNYLKRKKIISTEEISYNIRSKGPDPLKLLELKELSQKVEDAIGGIPQIYRDTVALKFFEERSQDEISKILGIPIGTVKSRIKRGNEKLRYLLSDFNPKT